MDIVSYQIDATGPASSTVVFVVVGLAADEVERTARITATANTQLDDSTIDAWLNDYLTDNAAAIQTAIDAGAIASDAERSRAATTGARAWYESHPNAALLFELSIDDLDAAIQNRNAAAETLLLKTLAVAVRVLAKREGLV